MNARRITFALVVAGLLVQFVLTARWQDEAAALSDQHLRVLSQHRVAARKVAELERRAALRARTGGLAPGTLSADDAVQKVRSAVVKALGQVSSSQLEVRPGPSPVIATVSLSTQGDFFALVRLVSTLARPGSGLVLQRVSITGGGGALQSLQVEAVAIGTPS